MNHIVSVQSVEKRFNGNYAVRNLCFDVPEGAVYGLLGPNGAGKTTTLRMILQIILPDSGHVEIFGRPVDAATLGRVGYLPEERGLYKKMKVREILLFFAEIRGLARMEAAQRIDAWLERLEAADWGSKKIEELSKGMQQKIQFLAAVLHDPELIIFDEPFAGLDPLATALLKDVMVELSKSGKTIIFSTHRLEQVEKLCDRICLVNKAERVIEGPLGEIKRRFGKNTVQVEFEGDGRFLEQSPFARAVDFYGNFAEVKLAEGADPQALLAEILARTRVHRFEVVEPSLNDIFIQLVKESQPTEAAQA